MTKWQKQQITTTINLRQFLCATTRGATRPKSTSHHFAWQPLHFASALFLLASALSQRPYSSRI